ncbi:MAG: electron transport complex subunit RsxC [bacterium]
MRLPILKTFKGGVHPAEYKYLTDQAPIRMAKVPSQVIIPLQQHTGAPCEPLVTKGDKVRVGQKIGDAKAFVSAPVHASISGTVSNIAKHPHPLGQELLAIFIDSDGEDKWVEGIGSIRDYSTRSPQELRDIVREAGIVGMGGAAFPTHVKLTPPSDKKIDLVLLNGAECEPYLTSDHRIMVERPAEVAEGLRLIMKILGVPRAIVGIERNKPDAIAALQREFSTEPSIEVVEMKVKYPQGSEKQLIKVLAHREVPSGGLPFDIGVVVQNVGTALAIYEAIALDKPLVERVITLTGDAIAHPANLLVRIGTPLKDLLDECGGIVGELGKVVVGGPMMGLAQYSLSIPVVKGTSGVLILSEDQAEIVEEGPCIRCGRCLAVCPMRLSPSLMADAVKAKDIASAEACHLLDCMECGSCAFVCPAKRHMVQWIKYGKNEIAAKRQKK